jgi:hypothetical protein
MAWVMQPTGGISEGRMDMDRTNSDTQGDFNEEAGTGALHDHAPGLIVDDSPENPTTTGLASGGEGTTIGTDEDQTGGPGGSGGGVVDRIGGRTTVGGESSGTIFSGSGMPPKPDDPAEDV